MKLKPVKGWEKWMEVCAWCGKKIPPGQEVLALSAKAAGNIDLTAVAGTMVPVDFVVCGKTIPTMIAAKDSPAKKDGKDLLFMVCSETCGDALRPALVEEVDLGRQIRERFEPRADR